VSTGTYREVRGAEGDQIPSDVVCNQLLRSALAHGELNARKRKDNGFVCIRHRAKHDLSYVSSSWRSHPRNTWYRLLRPHEQASSQGLPLKARHGNKRQLQQLWYLLLP
jgi:hypothetical protein